MGLPQVMNIVQAGCGNSGDPSDQAAKDCSRTAAGDPFYLKKERLKVKGVFSATSGHC